MKQTTKTKFADKVDPHVLYTWPHVFKYIHTYHGANGVNLCLREAVASVRPSRSCTMAAPWQMFFVMPRVTSEKYSVIQSLAAEKFPSLDFAVDEIRLTVKTS